MPPLEKFKPLSRTEMQNRARKFASDWKDESRENAEAQSWWNDFFNIFGVERRQVATFERWATRASTGNKGRIDVFMPRVMIVEHKSLGKDQGNAHEQALDYLNGGDITQAEFPRYIVSCDFNEIELRDLESDDPALRFPLKDLAKHVQRFAFLGGYEAPRRVAPEAEHVSVKAAKEMAKLQEALFPHSLEDDERGEMERAVFMTRLLFLLYADDVVGLWENKDLDRYVRAHTVVDGSDTGSALQTLFQILDTPRDKRSPNLPDDLNAFPYVNGHLFSQRIDIPYFTREMREALLRAIEIDWSGISPAIFGSLFQGLSTREERREAGEHYTTEKNILKTIRPLFLDELEERLQSVWNSRTDLEKLRDHLGLLRFLDPACGCGNFLIVAYREVASMEFRILKRVRELLGSAGYTLDPTWDLRVTPDHFAGIEINWWPAKIAETAMFLTEHTVTQQLGELGDPPSILPIRHAATIVHANALRVDWNDAVPASDTTYVFGNPPFIGQYTKTSDQTSDMKLVWGDDYDGYLDYVTGWHAKALAYLRAFPGSRFAFVTTNSIAQGQPVPALFGPIYRDGWRIRFAHQTFPWQSEAAGKAAVHCVIVGFDREVEPAPRLWSYAGEVDHPVELEATTVNAYLVAGQTVLVTKRSMPLSRSMPRVDYGSKPADGGGLVVEARDFKIANADEVARKYLRRYVGARELIHDAPRWCLWLKDAPASELRRSPFVMERLRCVKDFREASSKTGTRELADTPTLFAEDRQFEEPWLCIPAHFSEHRHFATVARFDALVVNSNANFSAIDPDGLLFGLISSSMFLAWQRTVGGKIKSDYRFSNTIVWNNFPLPELSAAHRAAVIDAGKSVEAARSTHPGQSLGDLYDPLAMPKTLHDAHAVLDKAVDAAFGFRTRPSDEERLARLFEFYAEMTRAGS